jgi:hypothetical protein
VTLIADKCINYTLSTITLLRVGLSGGLKARIIRS